MLFHTPSHGISTTLSKVLSTSDPWHIGPLTFGILNPLPMVFWTHYPCYIEPHIHGISNPYPWYFEPPTHGILISLSMLYWTPIHGISNPLSMVIWTPYPWYYATPTPYPWYIKPHIHDISNILPLHFTIGRVQNSIGRGSIYHELEVKISVWGGLIYHG
jgi:hypothetical protein